MLLTPASPSSLEETQSQLESLREKIPEAYFEKSDRYGIFVSSKILGLFFLSVALTPWICEIDWRFFFLCVPLVGWSGYKIQFILHDCSHKTLFQTKHLNEWVGTGSGMLVGVYFKMYRFTHMQHHRINGEPGDPQYPDYLGEKELSNLEYLGFIFNPLVGGRFISYITREYAPLIQRLLGRSDPKAHLGPAITGRWFVGFLVCQAAIATLATGFWAHPWLMFVLPCGLSTIALFLSRVRTLAEHQRNSHEAAHDFSRTHVPNFFDKLLFYDANFNFHVEHHLAPQLPSQHLEKLFENYTRPIHCEETLGQKMVSTIVKIYKLGKR